MLRVIKIMSSITETIKTCFTVVLRRNSPEEGGGGIVMDLQNFVLGEQKIINKIRLKHK